VNLAVQVCAVKREHPVAAVIKGGLCTGTFNSAKWWICLCRLYGHAACFKFISNCVPDGIAQYSNWYSHWRVTGTCIHLCAFIWKWKKITLMWRPRPSVRLWLSIRDSRLSDFREILDRSSSQKFKLQSQFRENLGNGRVYIRAFRMFWAIWANSALGINT